MSGSFSDDKDKKSPSKPVGFGGFTGFGAGVSKPTFDFQTSADLKIKPFADMKPVPTAKYADNIPGAGSFAQSFGGVASAIPFGAGTAPVATPLFANATTPTAARPRSPAPSKSTAP